MAGSVAKRAAARRTGDTVIRGALIVFEVRTLARRSKGVVVTKAGDTILIEMLGGGECYVSPCAILRTILNTLDVQLLGAQGLQLLVLY